MLRRTIILLIVLVLGLFAAMLVDVKTVQAQHPPNYWLGILVSPININCPSNSSYNSQLLTLNVTARSWFDPSKSNNTIIYSIDGKNNTAIGTQSTFVPVEAQITYPDGTTTTEVSQFGSYYLITGLAALPEMSQGSHYIKVYGKYVDVEDTKTVYFTVDTNPPTVSNVSLENKTYSQKDLSLNFTTDESNSWMGYSLDGQENVTIAGNTTLTGLIDGSHILVTYTNDTIGNTGTLTIKFTIAKPFSTVPVAVVSAVAVLEVAGLMVYFWKDTLRRDETGEKP